MSIAQTFLPEFEQEMASTRKVLERVPNDKLEWKAHVKSNSIGWVAAHLVEIAEWTLGVINQPNWDVSPPGGPAYEAPKAISREDLLKKFDEAVAAGKEAIAKTSDASFGENWSLLMTEQPIFTMPRSGVIRTFVINHMIHHRAALCVYLRLNDVPVPGMYGPSGDEG